MARPVTAYLSVGSNIEPERNVPAALEMLMALAQVTGISTFYRTRALNRPELPPFVNGVWRVITTTAPRALKYNVLREIEAALGRMRSGDPWGSRTMDLDILLYDDMEIREEGLILPDPDILERPFLAIPLVELDPEIRLPGHTEPLRAHPIARLSEGMEPLLELTQLLRGKAGL